jgi:hypothetical protein
VNKKLKSVECFARAEAYEECAEHLTLSWTDDPVEREAGEIVEKALRMRVEKWRALGRKRLPSND